MKNMGVLHRRIDSLTSHMMTLSLPNEPESTTNTQVELSNGEIIPIALPLGSGRSMDNQELMTISMPESGEESDDTIQSPLVAPRTQESPPRARAPKPEITAVAPSVQEESDEEVVTVESFDVRDIARDIFQKLLTEELEYCISRAKAETETEQIRAMMSPIGASPIAASHLGASPMLSTDRQHRNLTGQSLISEDWNTSYYSNSDDQPTQQSFNSVIELPLP